MKLLYTLSSSLYINFSLKTHGMTLLQQRGPGFTLPISSGFTALREEPSVNELEDAVKSYMSANNHAPPSEIVFAGAGEPMARPDDVCRVCNALREPLSTITHRVPLRISTSGLIGSDKLQDLKESGLNCVSVNLVSADAMQSDTFHHLPNTLQGVAAFIDGAMKAKLDVTVSTVQRDDVDLDKIRAFVKNLGIKGEVKVRSYHS